MHGTPSSTLGAEPSCLWQPCDRGRPAPLSESLFKTRPALCGLQAADGRQVVAALGQSVFRRAAAIDSDLQAGCTGQACCTVRCAGCASSLRPSLLPVPSLGTRLLLRLPLQLQHARPQSTCCMCVVRPLAQCLTAGTRSPHSVLPWRSIPSLQGMLLQIAANWRALHPVVRPRAVWICCYHLQARAGPGVKCA